MGSILERQNLFKMRIRNYRFDSRRREPKANRKNSFKREKPDATWDWRGNGNRGHRLFPDHLKGRCSPESAAGFDPLIIRIAVQYLESVHLGSDVGQTAQGPV